VTSTKKPYVPAVTPSRGKLSGTETLKTLCFKRTAWKFTNLGTWVVRDIRNKPGQMSQHSSGRAYDAQYVLRTPALQACAWFAANSDELGIALINDYMFGKYGRTWRSDRAAWKVHTSNTIGIRGKWIHIELHSRFARMPAADYEKAWRSVPKPKERTLNRLDTAGARGCTEGVSRLGASPPSRK